MAPVAIGTETAGSLILPAVRHALWTIKPKLGSVPNAGIMPISTSFDTAGPMRKTVQDAVSLLSVIAGSSPLKPDDGLGLSSAIKGREGWKDLRIGTLPAYSFGFSFKHMVPVLKATDEIVGVHSRTRGTFCPPRLVNTLKAMKDEQNSQFLQTNQRASWNIPREFEATSRVGLHP